MSETPQTPPSVPVPRLSPEIASAMLAQRCREDHAFAEQLRRDPRAALQQLSRQAGMESIRLPENIVLWENTPQKWHLAVPSREVVQDVRQLPCEDAIPDEMLEEVHGGIAIVVSPFLFAMLSGGGLVAAASVAAGVATSVAAVAVAAGITVPVLHQEGKL